MTMLERTCKAGGLAVITGLVAASLGCGSNDGKDPPPAASAQPAATASATATATASASSTAAVSQAVLGVPLPPEKVAKLVNPNAQPPYAGPTGTLRGTVRITGDAPPELPVKLPDGACRGQAAATHGKLFRVGQDGALADALVAVTGYQAYVPPAGLAAKLTISGCSFSRRTVVATYGQRIEVSNLDKIETYMPYLDGAPTRAILVAIPRGDAVRLYPQEPGHYLIRDQLPNPHLTADVFVLAYATHDVTGLDGKYEITGIPVGPVEVNAMLPATNKAAGQRIEIKPGDNTLDLSIAFDAKTDLKKDAKDAAKADPKGGAKSPPPSGPKG